MCQRKIFDERIFVEIFVFEKFWLPANIDARN
jgi:hypothetical protein